MSGIGFSPAAPAWLTVLLALLAFVAAVVVLWRMGRSGWLRAVLALVLAAWLLGPVRREVQTAPNTSTALLLLDQSTSMRIDTRGALAAKAAIDIRKKYPSQRWQVVPVGAANEPATRFEQALASGISRVPAEDLSGVVLITDGIVHDAAALQRFATLGKPVHVLLAGNPALIDRKLTVIAAPPFALVGQRAKITVRIDDAANAPPAQLSLSIDGQPQQTQSIMPNENTVLTVPVTRRGKIDIMMSVAPRANEVTRENNNALVLLNGVRDRLQVLLVSGAPYPGGRLWRDTLKSDPSIDPIHFTILRLPSSFDLAPNNELSLIPFPVDQLFEQRLGSFDLVIFDSFGALDLLDPGYFLNVADYVRNGGALFVIAGPEFGKSESLSSTALADLLPLTPTGVSEDITFTPQRTAEGARHPITATLTGTWGPWYQQARVQAARGTTLMSGARATPLVQIASAGKGRVGMIASNQLWVWARGEPAGPWNDLSRRMAHWLMKEPDLDSEKLTARAEGRQITLTRQSLTPREGSALVYAPDGRSQTVLTSKNGTVATGTLTVAAPGIYRVTQDGLSTAVMVGGNTPELRDVRPTDSRLRALAEATGGSIHWLKDGLPSLMFDRKASSRITGVRSVPLVPDWLALFLSLSLAALIWLSERK